MHEVKNLKGFYQTGNFKKKKQIILTNTLRNVDDFLKGLKYRYNGKNKKLPHYVIDRGGVIYEIIPPNTYSNFLDKISYNKNSIIICFENLGWLRKNPLTNYYTNWIGNEYKGEVYKRKWRGYNFWQPYTEEQVDSATILINDLCENFEIPKECIGHNVKVDNIQRFRGISSLSNYDNKNTSLNPAFDFDIFINKIGDE